MNPLRRHDRYVLRSFLGTLGATVLFFTSMVVLYDLSDRLERLSRGFSDASARGLSPARILIEYYGTLLPFIWIKIVPVATLVSACLSVTWLSHQNEIAPIVHAGVSSRRVLLPLLLAAAVLAGLEMAARESVVQGLSRRHDDLDRILSERAGRPDRFDEVPHIDSLGGERLSMAAYLPGERRMEEPWITVRSGEAGADYVEAYRYPQLTWDASRKGWIAPQGGTRYLLPRGDTVSSVLPLSATDAVPLHLGPEVIDLTVREGAAMGLSSAEIAELARAYPTQTRFRLLYHEQLSASVSTLVLLLIGLPLCFRLDRRGVLAGFAKTSSMAAIYVVSRTVLLDLGSRETLNPLVAAWSADVVFGVWGGLLWAGLHT